MPPHVAVVSAKRTPIGKFLGAFADLSAPDLGVFAAKAALREGRVEPGEVDEVVFGHARQAGNGPNPARQVAVRAGVPESIPAYTINQACGSGLLALFQARDRIRLGEARIVLAGGMECMSAVPHFLTRVRSGYRLGHAPVVDAMYRDGFDCPLSGMRMGETAELLAREMKITREEQDQFAARSQNRAESSRREGRFREEITEVVRTSRSGDGVVSQDEHPRDGVTPKGLGTLAPVFDPDGGTVTAGNSSGITDGAAALVLMPLEDALKRGIAPLAVLEDAVTVGVDPRRMGLGPVPAVRRLLQRNGRQLEDYDLVEINEAFAAQVLAVDRELALDPDRLNVNGGAIALGHPIGASGARIVVTLLHELRRRGGTLGLATLCVSGGMGLAASFSREVA